MYRKGIGTTGAILLVIFGVIAVGVVGAFSWYSGTYNTLGRLDEKCEAEWHGIENVYQMRYDLLPKIINATKLYINHEADLLTDIAEARSQWGKALASGDQSQMEEASTGIERVMGRLLSVTSSENYPELKADTLVQGLIDQITESESMLLYAREQYNNAVEEYNVLRRTFLVNMFFSAQYPERDYFEIADEAWSDVKVTL